MDPMAILALATAVFLGLALYFVLVFLHPYLFGARPY
jgi:hypothetical protein